MSLLITSVFIGDALKKNKKHSNYLKMAIPSPVSFNDELDMGLSFADFGLSFMLSGEEERFTKSEEKGERKETYSQ